MVKRKIRLIVVLALLFTADLWSEGQNESGSAVSVELEFFQNKPEAIDSFNMLLEGFMQENPGIVVRQNQTPDATTVLMTRLASNRIPETMSINGDATYGEIAQSGMLYNWKGTETTGKIHNAYIDMTQRLTGDMDNIYGIPYTANANTVLYNIDMFKKLGLSVPATWNELITVCHSIAAAGITPFFHTYADNWTVMVPWNSLAANEVGMSFFEDLVAGKASFSSDYKDVAEKLLILTGYGTDDNFNNTYSDGNIAFANGDSAMLIQGVWAIGEVRNANPDINIGVFALPVKDDAEKNLLVSGVDSILAVSGETDNLNASIKLIDYLIRTDVAVRYINEQKSFSAVKGVTQEDPVMDGIKSYFMEGRITFFPDHYYPPGMQTSNLILEFVLEQDRDKFLAALDTEYEKVMARR